MQQFINSLAGEIIILSLVGFWTVWIWKSEWNAVYSAWKARQFRLLPVAVVKLCGDVFLTQFIVKTFGIGGSRAAVAFGLILSNLVSYAFFVPKKPRRPHDRKHTR